MIQPERIHILNSCPVRKEGWVVYWMQQAQRAEDNHALEWALHRANQRQKPLVVFFFVSPSYGLANLRQYTFMLQGLAATRQTLLERNIPLIFQLEPPDVGLIRVAQYASEVVVDGGYTRIQREWREEAARELGCRLTEVESDVVVPPRVVRDSEAFAARSIRTAVMHHRDRFLKLPDRQPSPLPVLGTPNPLDWGQVEPNDALRHLKLDRSISPCEPFPGGARHAQTRLQHFIAHRLAFYDAERNDPTREAGSDLSPYLHFGQISPIRVAREVLDAGKDVAEGFLEELIVRRELAVNFCLFNRDYDRFSGLPPWARETLLEHRMDPREAIYTEAQLEAAETHDPIWNAAQTQLTVTGKMHGYMRMYWGKMILAWSETPEQAFRIAIELNDKYSLDGRDPNGYAGVAWCFGKHDRPWPERPVFGKVRCMTASGLKRKFPIMEYVRKMQ